LGNNQNIYNVVFRLIRDDFPDFHILPKAKSRLHRLIGWILNFPWFGAHRINSDYLTRYWTTFNGKTAYPIDERPQDGWGVLVHERMHLHQEKRNSSFIFQPFYLLGTPVYAVLFFLLTLLTLPLWILVFPWWISLIVTGVGLLLSCPIPFSYWRGTWEFEAYQASITLQYWQNGEVDSEYLDRLSKEFTTSQYFWMWPYKSARSKLEVFVERAKNGGVFNHTLHGKFYRKLYYALKGLGVLKVDYAKLDA
jgi:hypothetical protein